VLQLNPQLMRPGESWAPRARRAQTRTRFPALLERNDVLLRRGEHAMLLPELTAGRPG
jgi:hypothetical protein